MSNIQRIIDNCNFDLINYNIYKFEEKILNQKYDFIKLESESFL